MANYFKQVNEAFDKKYGLNGLVESKRKLKEANTDWYSMGWDDQVNAIKRFVKNYRGSKVFEDFAASVGADVDDVIDAFADMESRGVIDIPREIQIDDKYRNDDIYESKRRKLKEANNDTGWSWKQDREKHPLFDVYMSVAKELGVEPEVSSNGVVELYDELSAENVAADDFTVADEARVIDKLYKQYTEGKLQNYEVAQAISDFLYDKISVGSMYYTLGKDPSETGRIPGDGSYDVYSDEDEDDEDEDDADQERKRAEAEQSEKYEKLLTPKFMDYIESFGYATKYERSYGTGYVKILTPEQQESIISVQAHMLVLKFLENGLNEKDADPNNQNFKRVCDEAVNMKIKKSYPHFSWTTLSGHNPLDVLSFITGKDYSYLKKVRGERQILAVTVLLERFQLGKFKITPYVILTYEGTSFEGLHTVVSQNSKADFKKLLDAEIAVETELQNINYKSKQFKESFKKNKKSKKLIKEDGAEDFLDNLSHNLLLDLYDSIFDEVYDAAADLGSLPDYLPMTVEEAKKGFVDAVYKLAEAAFIKYCVDSRDDEFDEGIVKAVTQPIRDVADTVRDVLNISDKNTKLDEDNGRLGNEIDRYQKWVDFDMSRYGKISERTQQMVNKAGYQIIKDDHGDYEVAAGHFE